MEISRFAGLVNVVPPERLTANQLAVARDVDVDDSGALRTRLGQTQVDASSSHSMWASRDICLVAQGVDLKRMTASGALTQVARLAHDGPISYVEANHVVYFTNGVDTGRIVGGVAKRWGIVPPVGQPAAAATVGHLPAGRYAYAMTFLRSDGLQSGSRTPASIDLASPGGIQFTGMEESDDPDVVGRAIYLSLPNGEEVYLAAVAPPTGSTFSYMGGGHDLSYALEPGLVEPAPAGSICEVHAGVMYVADGPVLWYSEQYAFERFRRANRFIQMPGDISLVASVNDGLYVATEDAAWYLRGKDPLALEATQVLSYGAVPGTSVKFDSAYLRDDSEGSSDTQSACLWFSPRGVILGLAGGRVKNLTEDNFSFPTGQRGAGLFRVQRGYPAYVATLHGDGAAPNAYD